jgi:hypothetical protein
MQFARPSAASTAIYGMCSRTYLLYVSQISRGIHPGQNTWPSACPLASSDSEEAIEKCAIAFKSLAEIFGIDVFATIPLLLQPFAFRCELLGITPHHIGHQAVCLLPGAPGLDSETWDTSSLNKPMSSRAKPRDLRFVLAPTSHPSTRGDQKSSPPRIERIL